MKIEILPIKFICDNESSEFYLSRVIGLNFEYSKDIIKIYHSEIDVVSLDTLENYIYYLDWFGGKVRYKLVIGEDLEFIPMHHYMT